MEMTNLADTNIANEYLFKEKMQRRRVIEIALFAVFTLVFIISYIYKI